MHLICGKMFFCVVGSKAVSKARADGDLHRLLELADDPETRPIFQSPALDRKKLQQKFKNATEHKKYSKQTTNERKNSHHKDYADYIGENFNKNTLKKHSSLSDAKGELIFCFLCGL